MSQNSLIWTRVCFSWTPVSLQLHHTLVVIFGDKTSVKFIYASDSGRTVRREAGPTAAEERDCGKLCQVDLSEDELLFSSSIETSAARSDVHLIEI